MSSLPRYGRSSTAAACHRYRGPDERKLNRVMPRLQAPTTRTEHTKARRRSCRKPGHFISSCSSPSATRSSRVESARRPGVGWAVLNELPSDRWLAKLGEKQDPGHAKCVGGSRGVPRYLTRGVETDEAVESAALRSLAVANVTRGGPGSVRFDPDVTGGPAHCPRRPGQSLVLGYRDPAPPLIFRDEVDIPAASILEDLRG